MNLLICLKNFIAVVDHQGFSAASRKIFVSPANLSKQVSFLEDWLGATLLQRTTRESQLTAAGEYCYQHGLSILDSLDNLKEDIAKQQTTLSGPFTISCAPAFAESILAPILPNFIAQHQKVKLNIVSSIYIEEVIDQNVDLTISQHLHQQSLLVRKTLAQYAYGIYASTHYLQQHGVPQQPQDLNKHRCLLYSKNSNYNVWSFKPRQKIKLSNTLVSDDFYLLKKLMLSGSGIAREFSAEVKEEVDAGLLVQLLPDYQLTDTLEYYLYYLKSNPKIKIINTFLDFILKETKQRE